MVTLPFADHNHRSCVRDGLLAAERKCASEGLQLTPVRRRVLEILLAEHKALGAYEVLDVLAAEGLGAQPPVAYRALDFLVQNGLAHRIERLNAFTACPSIGHAHAPIFFFCRLCRVVAETDGSRADLPLRSVASETGFRIERVAVEVEGLCPDCVPAEGAP